MKKRNSLICLQLGSVLAIGLSGGPTCAQTLTLLKTFNYSDGANPYGTLVQSGSSLYGTTQSGGTGSYGTVFKINTDGSGFTVLKNFDVSGPHGPMAKLLLSGTTLYGTTLVDGPSGYGAVFKINTDGTGYTVLKHFASTDGAGPHGGLVLAGSTLFGTTYNGGASGNGTIFKINTDGSGFAMLKQFALQDGVNPAGDLVLSGSALYGTTYSGGSDGLSGTVFKINVDGSGHTVLKTLAAIGGNHPYGGLVLAGNTLFGAAYSGGTYDCGTLFKVQTDGTGYTVLQHFASTNGANPYATLTLSGTNLYGTTYNGGSGYIGTIFQINTNGGGFTVLKSLTAADGAGSYPNAGLTVSGTMLYGASSYGGAKGMGALFSFNTAPSPPSIPSITSQPQSRTNLLGTTASFQVAATPTNGLIYQWLKDGWRLGDGGTIQGSTSNVLTLWSVTMPLAGSYSVVVSNSAGSVTSLVATLTVNRPPVAGADSVSAPMGLPLTIPTAMLLSNDSDPDGDAISITTVQSPSLLGVTVSLAGGSVTYTAPLTNGSDRFTYTLADSRGAWATGTVNVTITGLLPATNQVAMQGLPDGNLRLIFLGWPTFRYALDRANGLNPPQIWQPLQTNWALGSGFVLFTNMPSTVAPNFYRVRRVLSFP